MVGDLREHAGVGVGSDGVAGVPESWTTLMSTLAASARVAAPWRRSCSRMGGSPACFRAGLQLEEYRRERYESAVGEVERLDTDDDFEYRMRVMIYLHVARFMRNLLDRKDRMSMAVGLEVRVPFCDHRIVEYVYNTSWSMKTYDGMEKSLLHGAVKDMLPESVAWRPKSPYPSTQDPFYATTCSR